MKGPSLALCSLASSARGCAFLVATPEERILFDCGPGIKTITQRCRERKIVTDFTAIIPTHGHGDHVDGARPIAELTGAKVFATKQTLGSKAGSGLKALPKDQLETILVGKTYKLRDCEFEVFNVPHDSFCVGILFRHEDLAVCYVTDAGHIDRTIGKKSSNVDVLVIETNYDAIELLDSDYPAHLKRRIASDKGHLRNADAGDLLGWHAKHGTGKSLKLVLGCHLGGQSNKPHLALGQLIHGWDRFHSDDRRPHIEVLPRRNTSNVFLVGKKRFESYSQWNDGPLNPTSPPKREGDND